MAVSVLASPPSPERVSAREEGRETFKINENPEFILDGLGLTICMRRHIPGFLAAERMDGRLAQKLKYY